MIDDALTETLDAVSRFTENRPIASTVPASSQALSAALWRQSTRARRFEGHQRAILAISLRGTASLEQVSNGRSVWRGPAPGSIILLRPGEATDWRLHGDFEMLHIYLNAGGIPSDTITPVLSRPFRDPLLWQIGQATALALRETSGANTFVAPLLDGLQQCLADRYFQPCGTTPGRQTGTGLTARAQRTIEAFIRERLAEAITAETLAGVARLSVGHFNRAFRNSFGMSPRQYLIEQRIARAANLLENTGDDIDSIARATGFFGASHLGNQFTRRMGVTPGRYRRLGGAVV